ncbi:MAG: HPF/RaiA family ribosome-associated protein [Ectothiorhodospiraceae bacterium]|nr:HPF/RaiA family ribosome-associated protein [Ectothiorhodospiraceae bacterium]
MRIDIQSRNFTLSDALHSHIRRRLNVALGATDFHIHQVLVHLSIIKRSQDSADKRCHIQVVLTHLPDVIIKNTESDMTTAITSAAERAGRATNLRLAQQRTKGRKTGTFNLKSYGDFPNHLD